MKKLIAFALVVTTLFIFTSCNSKGGTSPSQSTSANNGGDSPSGYKYTAFTAEEEQKLVDLIGETIPFIPNNEYTFEEYSIPFEYVTIKGIVLLAYGNTQEEFDSYREAYSDYESLSYVDGTGVTCYLYGPLDAVYVIEVSYYAEADGRDVVRADVHLEVKGGTAGIGTGIPYDELFTNEGVGLPSDPDGIYDLDFTKGEYIKDVTNQGELVGGCPPTGSSGVLVIPVQFSDVTAESKGYTVSTLVNAFSKGGETDYYSLYDYYYISSYGKLDLDITVLDFWFTPEHDSKYYDDFIFTYEDEDMPYGEQLILNEALDYLEGIMDLSQFDSDGNGTVDSVILVNTLELDSSDLFTWGYRYMNYYKDEGGSYYEYDGVYAKDYIWASYQFLFETENEYGVHVYDDTSAMNTFTFIHEFAHVLGLHDYYDYASINVPLRGGDIMCSDRGDHNAYSKFNLGWLRTSRLVVTDSSITLTLEDFSKNGDTVIIANNWDDKLGAYQEYYVLVYYTNNGVNAGEGNGYFDTEGIVVYHVNAAMYMPEDSEYYDVYNTNNDIIHERGTENDLIDYVLSDKGETVYVVGDTMPTVTDDYGDELVYSFTVDALTSEYATITVSVTQ